MGYTTDRLKNEFYHYYGNSGREVFTFFAPGRVNLIGEHTDYNGGLVLPFAIQYGTFLLVRLIEEGLWKFRSENMPFHAEITAKQSIEKIGKTWINYPLGVFTEFNKRDKSICGIELLYSGNIPNGAGLSSSASIELVTAFALNTLLKAGFSMTELIKMSQHAENNFVGMNCGIMDQFAVGMGKIDNAIFLNCDTLSYELAPFIPGNYRIIITNTNVRRELAGSAYNTRRQECEKVVEILKNYTALNNLSDISVEQWHHLQNKVKDPILVKRANHVINENRRVEESVAALKNNDLKQLGQLMLQSHRSLRDDYEVSCRELDTLVDIAMNTKGVIGSRMTGGGFGGCTISLVTVDQVKTFKREVGNKYKTDTGLMADFYLAEVAEGVRQIN